MKDNGFHVGLFCFLFSVYLCFLISDETVWQLVEHLLFYSLPLILSTVLLFNFTFLFFLCLFPICSPVFSLFSTMKSCISIQHSTLSLGKPWTITTNIYNTYIFRCVSLLSYPQLLRLFMTWPNHDVVVKEHNISDSPHCKIIQTATFLGLNF